MIPPPRDRDAIRARVLTDERLRAMKLAVAPGATTYDGISPDSKCLSCGGEPCECEIGMLRDALGELDRLLAALARAEAERDEALKRSDEHLRAHSASFGALSTISSALFDGEVDDYQALAEKTIAAQARLRQALDKLCKAAQYVVDVQATWGECTDAMLGLKDALADAHRADPLAGQEDK